MPTLCLDILGAADNDWKRKETARALPNGWGFGIFVDTFGDGVKATSEILTERKARGLTTPLVRFQFWRKHALTPMSALKKWFPLIEKLHAKFPEVTFFVSHSCEYQSQDIKGIQARVDLTRKLCPSCVPINTPLNSPSPGGTIVEVHGKKVAKPGQFISYDGGVKGEGLYDIDAVKWLEDNQKAKAYAIFLWAPRFNLSESKAILPVDQRTAAPNAKFITGMCYLAYDPGVAPTPAFSAKPFRKPQLLKTFAEDMPTENPRDNKLMIFTKENAASAELVTFDGQLVGKLGFFPDNKPHDLERYYSGWKGGSNLMAWEFAEKARKLSGHPWYWIRVGRNCYGPFTWLRTPFFYA